MPSKEKARSYRVNVKKPVYCIMLTDDASEVTYNAEIKSLGEAMQVQLTPEVATGELFGDGAKVDTDNRLVGLTLALDITKIPADAAAEIQGHTVTSGVIIDNASDEPPYIAIGYQIDGTGGYQEYVWLLKGKAQPVNDTIQQRTSSINYSTQTLNVNFVSRIFDENIRFYADTTYEDFTAAQASAWFSNPPTSIVTGV